MRLYCSVDQPYKGSFDPFFIFHSLRGKPLRILKEDIMKDAIHHLKSVQRKVIRYNRRNLEREGRFIQNNNEMEKATPNNGAYFEFDKNKKESETI